jgi:hypothetical protein
LCLAAERVASPEVLTHEPPRQRIASESLLAYRRWLEQTGQVTAGSFLPEDFGRVRDQIAGVETQRLGTRAAATAATTFLRASAFRKIP